MFVPGLSLVIPEVSREDPDGCLVIPLDCIAEAIGHHISEGVEFPDGCSDMDSLPDGQCLDPGLEAGDRLHDLHAVIARQALLPLVILGGDINGGQECLHQHVANGSLDVCDQFVYHAQNDVEGGDCQHINDKGVVRELEQAGVYKTK